MVPVPQLLPPEDPPDETVAHVELANPTPPTEEIAFDPACDGSGLPVTVCGFSMRPEFEPPFALDWL